MDVEKASSDIVAAIDDPTFPYGYRTVVYIKGRVGVPEGKIGTLDGHLVLNGQVIYYLAGVTPTFQTYSPEEYEKL